jgi:hypothetical protein
MREEVYVIDGITYTRVSKATARKLFNDGECVGICPVKLDPSSFWGGMCTFQKGHKCENWGFDDFVNNFIYYNCQMEETGKYPKFFKVVEDDV